MECLIDGMLGNVVLQCIIGCLEMLRRWSSVQVQSEYWQQCNVERVNTICVGMERRAVLAHPSNPQVKCASDHVCGYHCEHVPVHFVIFPRIWLDCTKSPWTLLWEDVRDLLRPLQNLETGGG
eukprot:4709522-Amphidinium_carterae.1